MAMTTEDIIVYGSAILSVVLLILLARGGNGR